MRFCSKRQEITSMQCLAKNIFSSNFSYRKITSITHKGQPDKGPSIKDIGNLKWEWRSQFFKKNLQRIGLKNYKHGGWGWGVKA